MKYLLLIVAVALCLLSSVEAKQQTRLRRVDPTASKDGRRLKHRRQLKKKASSKSKSKSSSSDENNNNNNSNNNSEESNSLNANGSRDPFYINTDASEFTTVMTGSVNTFVPNDDGTCINNKCTGETIIFATPDSTNTIELKMVTTGGVDDEELLLFVACPEETQRLTLVNWSCQILGEDRAVDAVGCRIEASDDAPFYDIEMFAPDTLEDAGDKFVVADVTLQCAAM